MITSVNELLPGAKADTHCTLIKRTVYLPPSAAERLIEEARRAKMDVNEMFRFCLAFTFEHLDEARLLMEPSEASLMALPSYDPNLPRAIIKGREVTPR